MVFTETRLWKSTLAPSNESHVTESARERYRQAFLLFRERAAYLADEIAHDLPQFTVHDATHLDALWEMADIIAGNVVPFTPTEAFVLGGAFLIHDLGMGLAALPDGRNALRTDRNWDDLITASLRKKYGRTPTSEETANPDADVEMEVVTELLRLRHAEEAENLVSVAYRGAGSDKVYHLIEDPELRSALGPVIGRVAYTHWWPLERVQEEFAGLSSLGPPVGCPPEWTVDQLKLACLMRTADAIHLDGRRAPGFLRALRKPEGYADLHWTFQQNVHQPQRNGERVVFTSGHRFTIAESKAWWVGYELIQTADKELNQVDALLQDVDPGYRFDARSVASSQDPIRFSKYIPTAGWTPVDAQVQVTDVGALVRNLGGAQLYGQDATVPLRELIQNASDAVRARRLLEEREEDWGKIIVRLGQDSSGHFIEVEDTGIGMTEAVLAGPFLDFGKSFWNTPMMHSELVGLQGKGFVPTGQYGIGFFSVFMWGPRVQVTTRPCKEGGQTRVLEFFGDAGSRPLIRQAAVGETVRDGGTRVRVYPDKQPDEQANPQQLLMQTLGIGSGKLKDICAWLCPSLDVTLQVQHYSDSLETAIVAHDWMHLDPEKLIMRVWGLADDWDLDLELKEQVKSGLIVFANNSRTLTNEDGKIVGRACLSPEIITRQGIYEQCVLTVGGLRATLMRGIQGLLVCQTMNAARNDAEPVVEPEPLANWATEQAELLDVEKPFSLTFSKATKVDVWAKSIRRLGGRTGKLPVAYGRLGWMSATELKAAFVHLREIHCPGGGQTIDEKYIWTPLIGLKDYDNQDYDLILDADVFTISRGGQHFPHGSSYSSWPQWISRADHFSGTTSRILGEILDVLEEAWGTSVESIVTASLTVHPGAIDQTQLRLNQYSRKIGTLNRIDLYGLSYTLKRP